MANAGLDVDFWLRHVRFGIRVSFALLLFTGPYLLADDMQSNRPLLIGIILGTAAFTAALNFLPWRRILESRHALWAFYAWSAVATLAITIAAWSDGGVDSPLLLFYALPMLYAAIAYPPRAVLALNTFMVVTVAVMALFTEARLDGRTWLTVATLLLSAWTFTYAASNYRASVLRSEALADRLAEQVNLDWLTGCLTHRAFQEELATEVGRAQRMGTPLSLVIADVDHFKQINDQHGHAVGDEILGEVGVVLREHLRGTDKVARIGGEEFAVLLPGTDLEMARETAERLRRVVGSIDAPLPVTISCGVAVLPDMADTGDDLFRVADLGLYAAKRGGRDCVAVHGEVASTGPRRAGTVKNRVAQLLDSDELHAHYQPIIDLRTGEAVAYEALARIRDSKLRPDQWLELADEAGLRADLEAAMLDVAIESWEPREGVKLFVNLSPDALASGIVWPRLDRMGSDVVIEVSERDPVQNYTALRETVRDLAAQGVRLAVDDVGAGHANMRHVTELLPAYVKLDRSLVTNVDQRQVQASLVAALAAFTADIGVKIIGEGIERAAEAATLRRVGVDLGQGYLIARPAFPPPRPGWLPDTSQAPADRRLKVVGGQDRTAKRHSSASRNPHAS